MVISSPEPNKKDPVNEVKTIRVRICGRNQFTKQNNHTKGINSFSEVAGCNEL